MKNRIAIIMLGLTSSSWAQSNIVDFRNSPDVPFPTVAERYVYLNEVGDWPNRLVGVNYVAGLWYVPGNNASAVDGRISPDRGQQAGHVFHFRANGTQAERRGSWVVPLADTPNVTLDGVGVEETAMLQVRVWDVYKYTNFTAAFAAGEFGASSPFSYTIPVPGSTPASYTMDNLRSFIHGSDGRLVTVADVLVAEGSNGVFQANFTFVLSQGQPAPVSVDFATQDGTALAGQDYVSTNGTITFAPGEVTKVLSIALTADGPAESDETFVLNLSNVTNGRLARPQATCTITEVRIANISLDTSIAFNTVYNHRYTVERSINTVNWEPVLGATDVVGTGDIITIVDRGAGCQVMRAYRARLVE
jgi:hypothetical protein